MANPLETFVLEVEAGVNRIDISPILDDLFGIQQDTHRGFFDSEMDPNGVPWLPLAPLTVAQKGHDRILEDTKELRNSLSSQSGSFAVRRATSDGFEFGTSVPYSIYHQEGAFDNNLPQRMHVGWSDESIEETTQIVTDYVFETYIMPPLDDLPTTIQVA